MSIAEGVFVHDRGLCESDDVGAGTRVWAFAHVMRGATVGADCNIGGGAFIERGAVLGDRVTVKNNVLVWDKVVVGDDVFLGPNAVFTNDLRPRAEVKKPTEQLLSTLVRSGATIGANATIVCGIEVGAYAFVGAGAVVARDVPAHALVAGNPGRQIGWACDCGETLDSTLACACGRGFEPTSDGVALRPPAGCRRRAGPTAQGDKVPRAEETH